MKVDNSIFIGKRFGRYVVTDILDTNKNDNYKLYFICKCDCGNVKKVAKTQLISGKSKSCGCYAREVSRNNMLKYHTTQPSELPTSKILCGMIYRCYSEKSTAYKDYGGRGIRVCDEWLGVNGKKKFYEWAIHNGWEKGLTIERKDVNGNYCPDNCCWIHKSEQSKNRRNNRYVTINSETKTVTEWCNLYNINKSTLYSRVMRGSSFEDALFFLIKNDVSKRPVKYRGEYKTLKEWCDKLGLRYNTIICRINSYHWSIEKSLETPIKKRS